jgi:hypothetical protein
MKVIAQLFSVFLALSFAILTLDPPAASCTGSDPCYACKNCTYCKHCAKEGGTCGICKDRNRV